MARIKRKRIQFNEESLNELYQEVYNDSFNYKAKLESFISKWNAFIKDESNVAAMGKELVALLNAIGKTNDQKIVLLKILKDIVYNKDGKSTQETPTADGQVTMSEEAKDELMRMAEEARRSMENN